MDANKEIVERLYDEVINKGNLEKLESLMDPDFRDHLAPQQPPGIQGFKDFLKMVSTAFPDIRVKIEDMIAEKDRVEVRLSISGTHNGILMGEIQPTGKAASWTGIDILKIENGKIKDRWSERNLLSMMEQIGAIK
ncbi:MAG: ester cyclase [Thermoleophilia bacterium]|nr:ester cyclase [Thermoleophilia bacterium]